MAFVDRVMADRGRVFMNPDHFATQHTWNGKTFSCVTDEEAVIKRKNNNVVDLSWDNNTRDIMVYCRKEDFPGRAMPNEHGLLDNRPMKIMQVNEDIGVVTIAMSSYDPKAVAYAD